MPAKITRTCNVTLAAAAAKSLQSCPTLCDPRDGGPPGSPVPGIHQARTLKWVAISFSNAWKWKVKEKSLSRVRLLATPWTAAHQAPPSMGFARQEYLDRHKSMEHSRVQKEDINRIGMQSSIFNITVNVIQSVKDCFFNKCHWNNWMSKWKK